MTDQPIREQAGRWLHDFVSNWARNRGGASLPSWVNTTEPGKEVFRGEADSLRALIDPDGKLNKMTPPKHAVTLDLTEREAHDLHYALATVVSLIDQVGTISPEAPLYGARPRLLTVAQRLDHERRHNGAVPNPNVAPPSLSPEQAEAILRALPNEMSISRNDWPLIRSARSVLERLAGEEE